METEHAIQAVDTIQGQIDRYNNFIFEVRFRGCAEIREKIELMKVLQTGIRIALGEIDLEKLLQDYQYSSQLVTTPEEFNRKFQERIKRGLVSWDDI